MQVWLAALRRSLTSRLFVVLAVMIGLYIAAGYVLARVYDVPFALHTQLYSTPMQFGTMWFVLGLVSFRAFYIMIVKRPARLAAAIWADWRDMLFTPDRIAQGVPVVIVFAMMFSAFTSFKSMIPLIHPFSLDPLFAALDVRVHGGHHPWVLLFPVLKAAFVTMAVSFVYKTWFVAKFCVLYWQAFSLRRPALRERFFITYLLVWIVNGTVLAMLLSSAGPCFYGAVTGLPDPYAPLMTFLRASDSLYPVWDLQAQSYLWAAYSDEAVRLFSGISAMPSMHVSLAFLFALLGWQVGRKTGIFFTVYLALILIGSVHLGWHYAIDGYAGMLTTWIIWVLVGRIPFTRPADRAMGRDRAGPAGSSV